jgi:hypothetical protein
VNQRKPEAEDVRTFIREFAELYAKHRYGATYMLRRPSDPVNIRRLLSTYPLDRLLLMAEELLTVKQDWINTTDRGIGILAVKASWLDATLCERAQKAMQPTRRWRLECNHQPACNSYDWHMILLEREREAV